MSDRDENHKKDALRVLRDFPQDAIDSLSRSERDMLLSVILGLSLLQTPPLHDTDDDEDDEETKTPVETRRKLSREEWLGDDECKNALQVCPGAPKKKARRRRKERHASRQQQPEMRVPRHVRALFYNDENM